VEEKKAGRELEAPNTIAYNRVLDVWRRSGERASAAQRMEEVCTKTLAYVQCSHFILLISLETFNMHLFRY
jgi:hypothetical protein